MTLELQAFSECDATARSRFAHDFAQLQAKVRTKQYSNDVLPAEMWGFFLTTEAPFPREFLLFSAGDQVVGRIGMNLSMSRPNTGYVGFFEVDLRSSHASKVATHLLDAACAWLRKHGVRHAYGPVNWSTWFPYRFHVYGEDNHRFRWEPCQPPDYLAYWKACGFEEDARYQSDGNPEFEKILEKTEPAWNAAKEQGFTFEVFERDKIVSSDAAVLHEISMDAFASAHLFEPIDVESFRMLYVPIADKGVLDLAIWLVDENGDKAGYLFGFPDQFHDKPAAVTKSIALRSAFLGKRLSHALWYEMLTRAKARGIDQTISAMYMVGNRSGGVAKKTACAWSHEYVVLKRDL